jgi:NAD(P)-dependent dehydrogenase (short-subunit alcohol dehydrogenase family)
MCAAAPIPILIKDRKGPHGRFRIGKEAYESHSTDHGRQPGPGRLDILFNNASRLGATPLPPLVEYPPGALEDAFRVNVVAPIVLAREVLPLLAESGGLIVNISSDAALGGYPGWGGYGLTKAALDLASLTLANELSGRQVGVAAVDPGDLRTRMHQDAFPGEDISDRPLPDVTLPFWAWLFGQPPAAVTGRRYRAQSDRWEVNAPAEALAEAAV